MSNSPRDYSFWKLYNSSDYLNYIWTKKKKKVIGKTGKKKSWNKKNQMLLEDLLKKTKLI
jgi:hypothetical protein